MLVVVKSLQPIRAPVHTLLLCRHGDSIWNGGMTGNFERFTGWTNVPLSQKGRQEAKAAANALVSCPLDIDACFVSAMARAQDTLRECVHAINQSGKMQPRIIVDYRLNERHYGALQGYIKDQVGRGLFGHDPDDVKRWRKKWSAVPPQLSDDDPRRRDELDLWPEFCGGENNIPRGESLDMVAKHRIRPFLDDVLNPVMEEASQTKGRPSTGLIVGHKNSLRALLGVICDVEHDMAALEVLESLKIPTGTPLVLRYQRTKEGKYKVYDILEKEQQHTANTMDIRKSNSERSITPHPSIPICSLKNYVPSNEQFFGEWSRSPTLIEQGGNFDITKLSATELMWCKAPLPEQD